ncbi:MAG: immunity 17 family protein [Peptostreptococcaceae bacterium]|nr:immunity 17 family protein [Peptostreptococcaceae bacterium]MDY5738544.1 immunity 17 family protein [Anaerovoracaceae bacterium]
MDGVFEFLKAHYQYVLIAVGLLFLIGAIRDWKWVYQATSGNKARHAFIFEVWGEKGYRVFIGICGLILAICGVVLLILG